MKQKKDLNYIAKVEKAIVEKYGDKAAQNPAAFWDEEKEKDYLEQIKEIAKEEDQKVEYTDKVETDGFFISKKLFNKETNRICPQCEEYSFSAKDDVYMNKYECCFKCFVVYVEGREDRWKKGWRPDNGKRKKST